MTGGRVGSVGELQAFVRGHERVHVIGRGSKPALHRVGRGVALADVSGLRGISDYRPQEYTVTVGAGTPVAEIQRALREQGQYLPFDPLFAEEATIGGTVAGNLSGSRRYRYGGARDFILGAAVVDGLGRAFGVGGKVVKNAAGFDLSKFLVGSLGRYAIMTELTFKVFPDAPRFRALKLRYAGLDDALGAVTYCNQSAQELDALDFGPEEGGWSLVVCLAGFADTLPSRAGRFVEKMRGHTALLEVVELAEREAGRDPTAELVGEYLVKVVISPRRIPRIEACVHAMRRRYSVGGNALWLSADDIGQLDGDLRAEGLRGLALRGEVDSPILGRPLEHALSSRVKRVLDPRNKLV